MTVTPALFVSAMTEHWQNTLGNVPSPGLQAVWHQLAFTFNRQIEAHGTPDGDRWKVLQPATGTGKSQGLAVYCSMLPKEDHPGVLIVTRLKAQADEIAATINRLAGQNVALPYHGDNRVPVESLSDYPVLVITHRAYEIGLDAINRGLPQASNWSRYHDWQGDKRKLVVIDEALDIIEEAQIDLDRVRFIRGIIPYAIAEQFPAQMQAIEFLENLLTRVAKLLKERRENGTAEVERERILNSGLAPMPEDFDMTELRRALREAKINTRLAAWNDDAAKKRLLQQYDTILRDINSTLYNWTWYAKKLGDHTINTARLIVPEDINGAVILDATASSNLIYELFDSKVDVIPVPTTARSYRNVTLHVSTGHAVGKGSMVRNAKEETPKLIENLTATLGLDRKILVVCHQWVEPVLLTHDTGFAAFDAGHWNAIDGRNDWKDFDTAVIFGLPYRDKTWSANTFMALRGLQDTQWLNADGERPFRTYKDVRYSLEIGQLVVSVVQAINRVQSRRVIDAEGNCPVTDVFILLPGDKTGQEILEGIKREMPGLNVFDWDYATAKRKPRKSNYEEALVRYAKVMSYGRKSISNIRQELGMSQETLKRLVAKARDHSSDLYQRLAALGVRYETTGAGRGARSFLTKV